MSATAAYNREEAHPFLRRPCPVGSSTFGDVLAFITGGYWIDSADMLRGPGVVHALIPEAVTQPVIAPYSVIHHTNAGGSLTRWESLIAYWRRADITGEAHIQLDGVDLGPSDRASIVQAMPFTRRADCNYKANSWTRNGRRVGAISIETQDRGGATVERTPWSLPQFAGLVAIDTCVTFVYGIACTVPTAPFDSGLGHHAAFKEWSVFTGKTCPGAARIRQMDQLRLTVAQNLVAVQTHTGTPCGFGRAA